MTAAMGKPDARRDDGGVSVAVVIPCFEQKRFLATAIESVLSQTIAPREIVVVDDGSNENLSGLVSAYPVKLIRQDNRGPSSARNTGLRAIASEKIVFLDSDDVLLADAIRLGLECFSRNPDAGFVYGAHRVIEGSSVWPRFVPASSHADLLRCNWIACPATVMFDRARLEAIGGFDESLRMCEDWDVFLRLSRAYPFAAHDSTVALYVKHQSNATNDIAELMNWVEVVREKEKQRGLSDEELEAWLEGEQVWRSIYFPPRVSLFRRLLRRAARLVRG